MVYKYGKEKGTEVLMVGSIIKSSILNKFLVVNVSNLFSSFKFCFRVHFKGNNI